MSRRAKNRMGARNLTRRRIARNKTPPPLLRRKRSLTLKGSKPNLR
jgi:hypothetical protein